MVKNYIFMCAKLNIKLKNQEGETEMDMKLMMCLLDNYVLVN
jgi:hypothetical protein